MSLQRNKDLEKIKWKILLRMIEGSVLPPEKALDGVAGQKAIQALESFLHEVFCFIREDVILKSLLLESHPPEIIRRESKSIQPGSYPIGVVTVESMESHSGSSSKQSAPVPILRLCGTYLERSGFGIGEQVDVFSVNKEVILRPVTGCVDGCDQSAGGVANG
jgi:hypothetical protein